MPDSANSTFDAIRKRASVRRFSSAEVPDALLAELLDLANRAPSGYNLQPWHFVLVRNPELKQLMRHIAMDQIQVSEAPAVVVFVADPEAWKTSYERVLELGLQTKQMSEQRVARYRKFVRVLFQNGPFGIVGFAKRIIVPFMRLYRPTPGVIASHYEAIQYVRTQTAFAAATFMIAAKSAGLDTSPMEGFDEERLKKLLAVPKTMTVPLIIAVGYPLDQTAYNPGVRLPLDQKLSLDLFPNRVKETPKS